MSYLLTQALALLEEATSYTSCETWSPSLTDEINSFVVNARAAQAATPAPEPQPVQDLPPLPKPDTHCWDDDIRKDVWSYSADQMHTYARAAMAAAKPSSGVSAQAPGFSSGVSEAATPAPAEQFRGARRRDAAEATLQRLGYEWRGGELWAPPLGKAPAWAATPAPAPLTLDEIVKLAAIEFPSKQWQSVEHLVRAVERAHGIGQGKEASNV